MTAAVGAADAQATLFKLETFKTSIDVKLNLTDRSIWKGIRPGCFVPHENFDMTYELRVDSTPSRRSQIRDGVSTLSNLAYGTTDSHGDKGSFRQYSSAAPWEIETQYPADCDGSAPPVPSWATSPTCKKTFDRVEAKLLMTSAGKKGDGSLVLFRTKRIGGTAGGNIGDSCHRTLHEIDPFDLDSAIAIDVKRTFIQMPVPELESKLQKISRGSAKSHRSFTAKFRVSGDCNEMHMSHSIGPDPSFARSVFTTPHQALGSFDGDATRSVCMIYGTGSAVVRREGPVRGTSVRPILSTAQMVATSKIRRDKPTMA